MTLNAFFENYIGLLESNLLLDVVYPQLNSNDPDLNKIYQILATIYGDPNEALTAINGSLLQTDFTDAEIKTIKTNLNKLNQMRNERLTDDLLKLLSEHEQMNQEIDDAGRFEEFDDELSPIDIIDELKNSENEQIDNNLLDIDSKKCSTDDKSNSTDNDTTPVNSNTLFAQPVINHIESNDKSHDMQEKLTSKEIKKGNQEAQVIDQKIAEMRQKLLDKINNLEPLNNSGSAKDTLDDCKNTDSNDNELSKSQMRNNEKPNAHSLLSDDIAYDDDVLDDLPHLNIDLAGLDNDVSPDITNKPVESAPIYKPEKKHKQTLPDLEITISQREYNKLKDAYDVVSDLKEILKHLD